MLAQSWRLSRYLKRSLIGPAWLVWLGVAVAAGAAEPRGLIVDDFAHPAWGVRWTTLEFSKHTLPALHADKRANGDACGRVDVPAGGRMLLRTQTEANDRWDGIRGKHPWLLPGEPKTLSLDMKVGGDEAVTVKLLVRDADKTRQAIEAQEIEPGDWRKLRFDVSQFKAPQRLFGIELIRQGSGTVPQPIWIDELRVEADGVDAPVAMSVGMTSYEHSLVEGDTARWFVRLQGIGGKPTSVRIKAEIQRQQPDSTWSTVSTANLNPTVSDDAATHLMQLASPKPGAYRVRFHITDTGGKVIEPAPMAAWVAGVPEGRHARPDLAFTVYRKQPLAGNELDGMAENQRRLIEAAAGEGFRAYRTNLLPAMALRVDDAQVQLFGGLKAYGLSVPRYCAFAEDGRVKVTTTDSVPALDSMSESWMVFFSGESGGGADITITSRGKRAPMPMDLPWLVVLQRRPQHLSREDDRLVMRFGKAADHLVIVPLYGAKIFEPGRTQAWVKGLPTNVAAQAREWAGRLKRFPVHVQEDFKVDAENDRVTIRQQFEFLDLSDDWRTEAKPYALVPPMMELARRWGFPVTFQQLDGRDAEVIDGDMVSYVGPVTLIEGTDSYQYTIRDVLKYINEDRLPVREGGGPIADELRRMMVEQPGQNEPGTPNSRWEPGNTVREDYGIAMVGNSERHGLLGSTIPYCEDLAEAEWRKHTLEVDARFLLNPNNHYTLTDSRNGKLYDVEGFAWTRFGKHNWVDNNAYQGEVFRALDYYVKYTGDLPLIRRHWPFLRSAFGVVANFKRHGEWELSCFDTGGGDTWDSVHNATVGFARLADRLGDAEAYQYACYYFAKHSATLAGHRQANKYIATHHWWPGMRDVARVNEQGDVLEYQIFSLHWVNPVADVRDLVFSDVWGANYGLRPWNQTLWMRGSRSEFRMAHDLAMPYARYWLEDRVRKFAPQWYQSVIVRHEPPGEAIDKRTGQKVKPSDGDYVGKINPMARAIILGDSLETLWELNKLRQHGVRFTLDGRVPRPCLPATLLEDGLNQPWVKLFGKGDHAVSNAWQRGRDAYMDLGDENYTVEARLMTDAKITDPARRGLQLRWRVFNSPRGKDGLVFGHFGPASGRWAEVEQRGVTWNTTVMRAKLASD